MSTSHKDQAKASLPAYQHPAAMQVIDRIDANGPSEFRDYSLASVADAMAKEGILTKESGAFHVYSFASTNREVFI